MNIWYISKYASPSKYFFGTRHFYLAEEWVKEDNNVCIITSNSSHLTDKLPKFKSSVFKEDVNGVLTIWLNTLKSKNSAGISRVLSWFHFDLKLLFFNKKGIFKPDVIIVSSLSLTTVLPGYILSKRYKCKFVFEVRDIWPLSMIILGGYSKNNLFIRLLAWIEKFGYLKANLIVGTIPNLKAHVLQVTGKSLNCICVPQGISTRFYHEEQKSLSNDYLAENFTQGKFTICYAGTINANNPLSTLIHAAKKLVTHSDIQFVILGSGNKKDEMIALADKSPNILFPPTVEKSQMQSFLAHVDVCYDSFESELAKFGLSRNKWMDYLYAEKPIICSFDGFQSILNEANCGTFVPYGDVDKLAETILYYSKLQKAERCEIGRNGKMFLLENRTFKTLSQKFLEAIKKA